MKRYLVIFKTMCLVYFFLLSSSTFAFLPLTQALNGGHIPCITISEDGFENDDLGIWNEGGGGGFHHESWYGPCNGDGYMVIKGDHGVQSSIFTDPLNIEGDWTVKLSFCLKTYSTENGDRFFVEYSHDGVNYTTFQTFIVGTDLTQSNGVVNEGTLTVQITGINFVDASRLRLRSQTTEPYGDIGFWFDDIKVEVCCSSGSCSLPCNCQTLNDDCVFLSIDGSPYECETLFAQLKPTCIPECWESIDWNIRLGSINQTYNDQGQSFTWDIPNGYYNHYLVVRAIIHLDNGQVCETTSRVLLKCSGKGFRSKTDKLLGEIDYLQNNNNNLIYPNPATKGSFINIEPTLLQDAFRVEIVNLNGQVVQTSVSNVNRILLKNSLSSGIYFVKITTVKDMIMEKIYVK